MLYCFNSISKNPTVIFLRILTLCIAVDWIFILARLTAEQLKCFSDECV